jgi:hypothetical protein
MKKLVLLFGFTFLSLAIIAQSNYNEAIRQGDGAQKRGDYTTAINKYFAAGEFDPSKQKVVEDKINAVFKKIDNLRKEADRAKNEALKLLTETEKANADKDKALNHAQKLIDAFYFYDGKFALAYKGSQFYFIDKNGDGVEKLGKWDKAEQFDKNIGFSKVIKKENVFLLDTLGNAYKYTNDLNKLDNTIEALDMSFQGLIEFPIRIADFLNLKILWLEYNQFTTLPAEIGKLTNLAILDLSGNQLTMLPDEIGKLNNLTYLNLSSTRLATLPAEIGNLTNLTELKLWNNQLTTLPAEIGNLTNLTNLNLSSNELTALPAEIVN